MMITMTMEEYNTLKTKAENYNDLVLAARSLLKHSTQYSVKNDCWSYVSWLSREDVETIVGQFGVLEEDA